MLKILIVEDCIDYAYCMQKALHGIGDVRVCTMKKGQSFGEYEFLTIDEVLKELTWSDIVLLDYDLNTDFTGKDLLPYCKKVIGTSSRFELSSTQFNAKNYASMSLVAEDLRELVLKM